MGLRIMQAEPEDTDRALDFYYRLIDDMQGRPYCPKWTKGVYPLHSDLGSAAEAGNLFLAWEGNSVIGAFVLNHAQPPVYANVAWSCIGEPENTAVLHLLAVTPSVQGRGMGRRLLEEAVRICRIRGDRIIRLDTTDYDVPAHKLYEAFGFHYCGDMEMYYPTTGRAMFRMYEYRV